jgi:hypothetical protein
MPWWPAAGVILVLILVAAWFFWSRSSEQSLPVAEEPRPITPAPSAEIEPVPEETTDWDLPSLAESDDFLRDVATRLSSHPEWLSWIATDDLVRRFVGAVDEVARGEMPSSQLGFLVPKRGFSTVPKGGQVYLGADSQRRFTRLAAVVSGLDARGVADLYNRLQPLFRAAYRELGYPNTDFDAVLARAMERVLDTPDLGGTIELVPALRSYKYADPRLEALPPVQKAMIRLGSDNAGAVKRKLREIARELDRSQITAREGGS